MAILLKDIWSIDNLADYKIHFARVNENKTQPLDAWIQDRQKWQRWQQTRPWWHRKAMTQTRRANPFITNN